MGEAAASAGRPASDTRTDARVAEAQGSSTDERTGAALALLLAGCSGSINVTELDLDEKPGKVVNGVPFRVKERYQVEVYEKGKKGYALIHSETRTLANSDKLYVLHYFGGPLANSTTKFVMQPDGSINDVSMSVTSQGEGGVDGGGQTG